MLLLQEALIFDKRLRGRTRKMFLILAEQLMPLVRKSENDMVKSETIRKLQQLEKELGERHHILKSKIPNADRDPSGRQYEKPTLGQLLRLLRFHLKLSDPRVISLANDLWVRDSLHIPQTLQPNKNSWTS